MTWRQQTRPIRSTSSVNNWGKKRNFLEEVWKKGWHEDIRGCYRTLTSPHPRHKREKEALLVRTVPVPHTIALYSVFLWFFILILFVCFKFLSVSGLSPYRNMGRAKQTARKSSGNKIPQKLPTVQVCPFFVWIHQFLYFSLLNASFQSFFVYFIELHFLGLNVEKNNPIYSVSNHLYYAGTLKITLKCKALPPLNNTELFHQIFFLWERRWNVWNCISEIQCQLS